MTLLFANSISKIAVYVIETTINCKVTFTYSGIYNCISKKNKVFIISVEVIVDLVGTLA